jgi:hypothetical protein
MRRLKTTLLIAAALAVSLSACETAPSKTGITPEPDFWTPPKREPPKAAFAPACPTPTAAVKLRAIEAEIERAIKAGAAPDTLATEWERLDQAAMICRKGRA